MVGKAKLSYDQLTTVVIEVEAVINSRPLTYVSSDDFEQPLTPAHLLSGRRLLSLPDGIYCKDMEEDFETTPQLLTKRLIYLNRILNEFWKQWRTEYLLELREAHRHGRKTSDTEAIGVGDIVLVHDDSKQRGFWQLARARVVELVVGRDGQTRGAVLKLASSGDEQTTLRRPLQHLLPFRDSHFNSKMRSLATPQKAVSLLEKRVPKLGLMPYPLMKRWEPRLRILADPRELLRCEQGIGQRPWP